MHMPSFLSRSAVALSFLAAALVGCGPPTTTGEVLTPPGYFAAEGPIAVSPNGIYFIDGTTWPADSLMRIPLAGGAPTTVDPNGPSVIVGGDDGVFFVEASTTPEPIETIAGATAPELVGSPGATLLAVGGGNLAWVDAHGTIRAMPSGGATASANVIHPSSFPKAIAIDATRVYWVEFSGEVRAASVAPGAGDVPTTLGSGASVLAVGGGFVYWLAGQDVMTVPKAGGQPTTVASDPGWNVTTLVADASAVYWMTDYSNQGSCAEVSDEWALPPNCDPAVWMATAGGGSSNQVLGGDAGPAAIALDASFLYWVDDSDGGIHRLAR
jgi:hypothetical protein